MAERLSRYRSPTPELDRLVVELLDATGAAANRDQLFEIIVSAVRLAVDQADRLDLKITNAALKEMRYAFKVFSPYRGVPKVTMFGSARTLPDDPLYAQTREVARALAGRGWMVVTGAGPGIMAAGVEGAGIEHALGVNIRLPFEQEASEFIAGDKLVSMKYFFTRKLMLMKESAGFVVLPGGFGTLDEALELLTLTQTGKAEPKPIVLLEVSGGTYWKGWQRWVRDEIASRGYVSPEDLDLFTITDDANEAVEAITGFYANYHSLRWVGDRLVIRMRHPLTDSDIETINREFSDIVVPGSRIQPSGPLPPETDPSDVVELPRLVIQFNRLHFGRLIDFVHAVNRAARQDSQARPEQVP